MLVFRSPDHGDLPISRSIDSPTRDDDQLQRSARHCGWIIPCCQLRAARTIELDLVIVERCAGDHPNEVPAHLFVHHADTDGSSAQEWFGKKARVFQGRKIQGVATGNITGRAVAWGNAHINLFKFVGLSCKYSSGKGHIFLRLEMNLETFC